jgi:ADP-ribose pyrophosphatase YjhB (NUDIX family)
MIRLWCATVYLFDPLGTQTLLINHHKLGKWVPPGGKIDPNELPDDAAIRECKEETGLDILLLGETPAIEGCKVRPAAVQVNTVIPHKKEHIDLVYVALVRGSMTPCVNPTEAAEARWFTISEVLAPAFNTFRSVQQWVEILPARYVHSPRHSQVPHERIAP